MTSGTRLALVLLACLVAALACTSSAPNEGADSATDTLHGINTSDARARPGDAGGLDCAGLPATSLDDLWSAYFAPSSPTGCAIAGCHASATEAGGGFMFTTAHELWQAAVGKPATAGGGSLRVKPGDPQHSYLYLKLLEGAPMRMPAGGPYLSSAALAQIAGWICAGAKEPAVAPGDAAVGSDSSVTMDAGSDSGVGQTAGPVISAFSPSEGLAGTMVTLMGSGFSPEPAGNLVSFHGAQAAIVSASSTQLVVTVPPAATTGPIRVEVKGQSAHSATDFQVIVVSPIPVLAAVSPAMAAAGAGDLVITVTGSDFVTVSVVELDGAMLDTTFQSDSSLTASVPAALLATVGNHTVTVTTRGPGGGTSAGLAFAVENPVPTIAALMPDSIVVGSGALSLTVMGSGFVLSSQITLSGADAAAIFISPSELSVTVPDALLASLGVVQVAVTNPAPGGGTSSSALTVGNPLPTLGSIMPGSVLAGRGSAVLALSGSDFATGSVAQLDGSSLTTTRDSSTQLHASVDGAVTSVGGTHGITVLSPGPGGGVSASQLFVVDNPVPVVTGISPSSVATQGAAFTLTIKGSGFNQSSVVHFDGSPLATTFVDAATVMAQIPSIAGDGSYAVSVSNPAPGGGSSSDVNLVAATVTAPTITGVSPASAVANTAFALTVSGSGYACASSPSQLLFNGAAVTINSCSATALQANIPATAGGNYSVQVRNTAASSNTVSFAVVQPNPVPSLASLSPSSGFVGGATFTLTVNGSGFVQGAVVSWNGNARTTAFVSAAQVTASISAGDIAAPGDNLVTVSNPTPGGGTSGALTFSVAMLNPLPSVSGLTPASVIAGSGAVSVSITGSGFIATSSAAFNGSARTTSYTSSTQLSVALSASDTQNAGSGSITVSNPAPGGGTSGPFTFAVIAPNPAPTLSSLSPTNGLAGGAAFTLTLDGAGFVPSSSASWNGVSKPTSYVSAARLTASISASDIASAGSYPVRVTSPAPGGGSSATLMFEVDNPAPSIGSIAPSTVTAGSGAFSLTVNGSGFVSSSAVLLDGATRTTHFVNATQLTADLLASDDSSPTTHTITVQSPSPGGGTSAGATLTVASQPNPVPTITSLSPCGAVAGASAFTLTLNGTSFVAGATVTFNGTAVGASFVGATQLTAAIPAALVAGAPADDAARVIATNPGPGGGASNTVSFGVATQASTLATNVQPIFTVSCTSCHRTGGSGPMSLVAGQAYGTLVGVNSTRAGCTTTKRVLACGPLRSQSVLIDKIEATTASPACAGLPMPRGGPPLSAAQQQLIVDWVAQGAPP